MGIGPRSLKGGTLHITHLQLPYRQTMTGFLIVRVCQRHGVVWLLVLEMQMLWICED